MKILFLVPYPRGQAPSQRFRFEQYLDILAKHNISFTLQSFWDERSWRILYKPGNWLSKGTGLLRGFGRRLWILGKIHQYDLVFVHREASPIGPPLFEWIVAKIFNKRLIYDFDDAIWLPNTSANNQLAGLVKWHHKVRNICRWAYRVSAGNQYLCDYAKQFNSRVVLNPTTIDTENYHNQLNHQSPAGIAQMSSKTSEKIIIGWTGTHSTLAYLASLVPLLSGLEKKYLFELRVIANQPPDFQLSSLHFIPWSKETEITDLLSFDIGIMPLFDDQWAKGKCGFKALQYMALGIPALVSPVGVNNIIIDNEVDGFICNTSEEWESSIIKLLCDSSLRSKIGQTAREKVRACYSVQSNTANFLSILVSK
jgi:glycosyltransferase involved in cell wall biosynthesis